MGRSFWVPVLIFILCPDEKTESRNDLSSGEIGGVIVAVISLVLLVAVVFIVLWIKRKKVCRRRVRDEENVNEPVKHLLDLNMDCSFWVFVLFIIFCPGALSEQISITARVGSTAVLPCDCSNVIKELSPSQSHYVVWYTSGTVCKRSAEGVYQGEGYKGRVDVPEDQLLKGNCSLVLKNVRAEDEGVYKSSLLLEQRNSGLQYKRVFLHRVELLVKETTETNDNQRRDSSDEKTDESRDNLSPGEIGGVIVAVISLVLLGLVVSILFRRRGRTVCRRPVRDEENVKPPDSQNQPLQPLAPGGRSGGSNGGSNEDATERL